MSIIISDLLDQSKPKVDRIVPQKSPNKYACVPTITAMILQKPVADVLRELGHDGSEVTNTEYQADDPRSRQGFTLETLLTLCESAGFTTWFTSCSTESCEPLLRRLERARDQIFVMYGTSERGIPHVSILYNGVYYDTDSSRNNIPGMTVQDVLYVQEPIDGSRI